MTPTAANHSRRAGGLVIAGLVSALCLIAFSAAPALAARGHVPNGHFGSKGSGPGQLKEPSGVAVSEGSGDVYVVDKGNDRVEWFSATGKFEGQFDGSEAPTGQFSGPEGIAVDNDPSSPSYGDVYVADVGHRVVDKFTPAGVYLNQQNGFGGEGQELEGVGVDPSGNLWVATHIGAVLEFNDAEVNEAIGSVTAKLQGNETFLVPGFAVDGRDDVFTDNERGAVAEFSVSGVVLNAAFDTEPVSGLAAELGSGDVYADDGGSVARLSPAGIEAGVVERLSLPGGHGSGVAVNSHEEVLYVAQAAGDVEMFVGEQPRAPTVERETVSKVTGDSATLEAEVNPRSLSAEHDTEYHFEYTTAERFEREGFQSATVVPGGSLAASFKVETIMPVNVQGLAPGTTYYFRVFATNRHGETEGQRNAKHEEVEVVHTFTTQSAGSLVLPDERQWELVSPPDKHGALIEALGQEVDIQAAVGGGAFTYAADAPTEAGPRGYVAGVQVLSTRTATGWSSRDLTIPHESATREPVGVGKEYRVFSEDLSEAVVQPFGSFIPCGSAQPCLSDEASEQTAFLASSYVPGSAGVPCAAGLADCFKPLVTGAPGFANVPAGTHFGEEGQCSGSEPEQVSCGPKFVGASPDLNHVVVRALGGLYEWNAGRPPAEQLAFINELPQGGGAAGNADIGLNHNQNVRHAVSSNGSRVFWGTGTATGGPLYVRDVVRGESLRVGGGEAKFQDASADGSRVFYTEAGGLFECLIEEEAGSGKLKCVTSELGSGVVGSVIGASEDGSWVYFVSNGVLAAGGVPGACAEAVAAQPAGAECDLYVRHGGVTRLVAVLGEQDFNDWAGSTAPGDLATLTGRVSPDGEWLAFMSGRSLTGYDNRDAVTGRPDQEVYLYDAAGAGRLVCASCDPSGARPVGEEGEKTEALAGGIVGGGAWQASSTLLAAAVPSWNRYRLGTAAYQSRYLSDSGRLFFDGFDSLVGQAVNGNWDVYEYEPAGTGPKTAPCGPAAASGSEAFRPAQTAEVEGRDVEEGAGCVALISSGESDRESAFLDASGMGPQRSGEEAGEEAEDVFFLTAAKLSPKDTDNALDVYDAHECSQAAPCFPAPAVSPPECNTEASCKPAPEAPPSIYGAPASATFNGPGNLAPPAPVKPAVKKKAVKCPKGKTRNRKGKCVKSRKKSKQAKKSNRRAR